MVNAGFNFFLISTATNPPKLTPSIAKRSLVLITVAKRLAQASMDS